MSSFHEMWQLRQRLRFALRSLSRRPVQAVVVVALLTIGFAAAGSVLTFLRGAVLSPFPYAEPERIHYLYTSEPRSEGGVTERWSWWSGPDFLELKRQARSFEALGMRLLRGRLFGPEDHAEAPAVMVVDQAFAETHWPGVNPLGETAVFGGHPPGADEFRRTVVGVVATVRHNGLDVEPPRPQMYFPFVQQPSQLDNRLVVKTTVEPESLIEPVRQAVLAVDPEQPIHDAQPYRSIVEDSLADRRLSMSLFGFFAAVAALLALVGIYGVVSYGVARRTQELGVRIAIGARAVNILLLVLKQVGQIALIGVGIGAVGALLLVPYMKSQLFGISAYDPAAFVLVPVAVLVFALLASLLPARRAARIQPTEALRYE